MAKYVDGFLLPVARRKLAAYKSIARKSGKIWMEYGALAYFECVGDDMKSFGALFPKAAKTKAGEVVVFSYIVYRSKAHRDSVNTKIMKDPRLAAMCGKDMPFDVKRMCYGGFRVLVEG